MLISLNKFVVNKIINLLSTTFGFGINLILMIILIGQRINLINLIINNSKNEWFKLISLFDISLIITTLYLTFPILLNKRFLIGITYFSTINIQLIILPITFIMSIVFKYLKSVVILCRMKPFLFIVQYLLLWIDTFSYLIIFNQ